MGLYRVRDYFDPLWCSAGYLITAMSYYSGTRKFDKAERGSAFLAALGGSVLTATAKDGANGASGEASLIEAPVKPVRASPQIISAPWNAGPAVPWGPCPLGDPPNGVDEATKMERLQKIKKLMEQRKRAEEEKKREHQAVRQRAEAERRIHLSAISKHKQMFLNDD